MASKLFDYDNPFFMFMSRIWDLMILNFLAVLLCLPVITAGASVTALYYITLKMAEDRESHIYRSFLKAFRDNLVQSTAIHLIVTAAGAVLLLDFWYFVLGAERRELQPPISFPPAYFLPAARALCGSRPAAGSDAAVSFYNRICICHPGKICKYGLQDDNQCVYDGGTPSSVHCSDDNPELRIFLYHVSLCFMAGILGAVRPGLPEFTPALQNI